jgi:hypothetical protein
MSEQIDLFDSNKYLSLLSKITIVRPENNLRATELLRDPETSSKGDEWAFIVPQCYNDAMDIKKTIRCKHKKGLEKHKTWTQGSTFYFQTGDIFYNKREAYTDWPKAMSDELCAIQVISGKSSAPGKNGKNARDRDKGEVTYTFYRGSRKENVLKKEEIRTTTQDDFIKILILGIESASL